MNSQPDAPPGDISAASSNPAARLWSVRTFLVWLVLACLLPGIIGATALFAHIYRDGRAQLQKDRLLTARALAQAVDNQILRVEALAHGLATATPLARGDLAGFHRQARETLKRADLVASVVLIDRSGWQVLNTLKEFGEPLPFNGNPELMNRVFETGKPVISDIYLGAVMRRPIMTVAVPVLIDGRVDYVLIAPIRPAKFNAILEAQGLPAGWLASIVDSTGSIMARTGADEELVGRKAAPEFLRHYAAAHEGKLETIAADGSAFFSVFTRSSLTHWGVVIDIPRTELAADLTHALAMLAAGILALFAIGLALAWFMGKRIGRSIQALVAPASALGAGRRLPIPPLEVQEAAELAKAMDETARLLHERTAALQAREAELAARTAALRQSEIRLRTLTQHAPVAIAVFDREMRYLAASRRWLEEYRLGGEDIAGRSHYQLFPKLPEKWKETHRRALGGEAMRAEADCYERTDGSQHWMRWEVWPWRDDGGEIGGIVVASEDITERKEAERQVQRSEEKYRTLFSNMAEGFALGELVYDAAGSAADFRFLEANEAFYRETGLPPAILQRPAREYLPELEDYWLDCYEHVVRTGESRRLENFNADTSRYYDLCAFRPSPGHFAIVFRDITEIKRVESRLQESEAYLWQLIAALPGMVWTCTPDGAVEFMNRQWLDYTGTTLESQLGTGAFEPIHPADRDHVGKLWQEALAKRTDFHAEYRLRRHDGTYRWFKSRGTPLQDSDGKVSRWLGVVTDIDDLKRSQEALRLATARFETALKNASVVVFNQDLDLHYTWIYNPALGYTAEQILGRSDDDMFERPEDAATVAAIKRQAMASGEGQRREVMVVHGGRRLYYDLVVEPQRDAEGTIVGVTCAAIELTGRKEAEMALRDSEERLVLALDAARMMSFEYDRASGRIRRRGNTVKALGIGFDDDEKSFFARIHPEDRRLFLSTLNSLTPEKPDYSLQYRFRLPDGTYRWLVDHSRARFDEGGRLAGVQGVFMDYEAQKEAELQLAAHAQRQTLLLEAASGILENWGEKAGMARIIFDKVSRHLDADVCLNYRVSPETGGLELLTGIGIAEEVRQAVASLPSGSAFCGTVAATGALLVADQKRIGDDDLGEFPRAMGLRAYVGCPLYSPEGGIAGTFALASTRRDNFSQDEVDFIQTIAYFLSLAWERWRIEKQVQELNAELERRVEERTAALVKSNLELQRFAYIAAHDLQTPLRSIASFTQLLGIQLKDRLDDESGGYMQRISENARRMQNLINDLLAYARLDAQARPFKETDMRRLLEEVKGSLAGSIRESGAALTCGELPTLFVDPTQIAQVFANLIENGIKYNQSGQIEIRISARREGNEWIFAVADNGIGIEPRHQAQIFAAFKRLHAYHQYPGSGVGLAICQRVIERHGGRIWVESVPGRGSTFHFALPAMRREAAGEPKPRPPA